MKRSPFNIKIVLREYWDSQILNWETKRYGGVSWNPFSWPLRIRMKIASEWINAYDQPEALWVDLGCGSGILRDRLGPKFSGKYVGVDFSASAIEHASENRKFDRTEFRQADVIDTDLLDVYGAVALGLSDWIERAELEKLLAKSRAQIFILSYTQKSTSTVFQIYRRHQNFRKSAAERTGFPVSYEAEEFRKLIAESGWMIFRESATGWGPGRVALLKRL